MKHYLFLFTIISIFFSIPATVSAQADTTQTAHRPKSVRVTPGSVSFNLGRGQSATKIVHVINNLSETKSFKVSLEDWIRDSTGSHIYIKSDSFTHSCARWVTTDKTAFTLDPGQVENISVYMMVPDSEKAVSEMKWTMLIINTVEENVFSPNSPNKMRAGITQEMGFGVHIYQTPPNVTNASVKMLGFAKIKDKEGYYRITCQNNGGTQLSANAYIELTPMTGKNDAKKTKVGPISFPLFPGQRRVVDLEIPKDLPKGKYIAVGAVDGGSDIPLEAAQGVIEIK